MSLNKHFIIYKDNINIWFIISKKIYFIPNVPASLRVFPSLSTPLKKSTHTDKNSK